MALLASPAPNAQVPLSPGMPSLGAIPIGGNEDAGRQRAGAVPKMFFSVEKGIDTLAKAVPSVADKLDEVKLTLRGIMAEALDGAGGTPSSDEEMEPIK